MLSQEEIGEIRTQYRQAKKPEAQIGILADLYGVSKDEIRMIVGVPVSGTVRPKAEKKNNKARFVWDAQMTARMLDSRALGHTTADIAEELGIPADKIYSRLSYIKQQQSSPAASASQPAAKTSGSATPRTLAAQAKASPDARLDRITYLAFDRLAASMPDSALDIRDCWRAALREIETIVRAWAHKIEKHADSETALAEVIALFALDELLEREEKLKENAP